MELSGLGGVHLSECYSSSKQAIPGTTTYTDDRDACQTKDPPETSSGSPTGSPRALAFRNDQRSCLHQLPLLLPGMIGGEVRTARVRLFPSSVRCLGLVMSLTRGPSFLLHAQDSLRLLVHSCPSCPSRHFLVFIDLPVRDGKIRTQLDASFGRISSWCRYHDDG